MTGNHPDTPTVDAIVVSWNHRDLLIECLRHIEANRQPHRLIVVDNGSTDGSAEAVRERFPNATVVALEENIGYGPAFNRGVDEGDSDVIFFINNDANISPDFLEKVAAAFSDRSIGLAGGIAVNPRNGSVDAAGIQLDRGVGGYLYLTGERVELVDVDSPTLVGPAFAAAAVRRTAFEEAEGFDPAIFAYCEEVDLVMRMRNAGWNFVIDPDARAEHIGSATLGSRTLAQMRHAARGRGYVAGAYRISPLWLLTEVAVGLVDSARLRSFVPLSDRVKGWLEGRRVPRRRAPVDVDYLNWWQAMRLRLKAM